MIIMSGVAGAGKSTQCKRLADSGEYQWLYVGDLLRHSNNQQIHDQVSSGHVVGDDIVIPLVSSELQSRGDTPELLLDGFPRSLSQAQWLLSEHNAGNIHIRGIIHLELSEDIAKNRLEKRGRGDDYGAAISERFHVYENVVVPVLEVFRQSGITIYDINGNQSEEEVHSEILRVLHV